MFVSVILRVRERTRERVRPFFLLFTQMKRLTIISRKFTVFDQNIHVHAFPKT